jgi:hypothetical protein
VAEKATSLSASSISIGVDTHAHQIELPGRFCNGLVDVRVVMAKYRGSKGGMVIGKDPSRGVGERRTRGGHDDEILEAGDPPLTAIHSAWDDATGSVRIPRILTVLLSAPPFLYQGRRHRTIDRSPSPRRAYRASYGRGILRVYGGVRGGLSVRYS